MSRARGSNRGVAVRRARATRPPEVVRVWTPGIVARDAEARLGALEAVYGQTTPCTVIAPDGIPYQMKGRVRAMFAEAAREQEERRRRADH